MSKLDSKDVSDQVVAPSERSADGLEYEVPLVTELDWIKTNITNDILGKLKRYFIGIFPILSWIYRYNFTWALGGISLPGPPISL